MCIRLVRCFHSSCVDWAHRGELSPYPEQHFPCSGFVSTKVGPIPVDCLAEIRNDRPRINPLTPGRQLEHARSGLRVEPRSRYVLWHPPQSLFFMFLEKGRGCKIMIKVVVDMAAAHGNTVTIALADMEDVVPRGAVLDDPATATQPTCAAVIFLENSIVEDVHVARHPPLATRVPHLDERSVGHIPAAARRTVGTPRDVSPDVEGPDGNRRVGYGYEHVLDVVVPYPYVLIAPLGLDAVVPAVGDVVAVDVAVRSGKTPVAAIVSGTHPIVEVVILVRPALVIPDDMVARRLPENNRLRTPGVGGLSMLLRPAIRIPRRVVQPATLDNNRAKVPVVAEDASLVILSPALLAFAAPLADIAVLDNDVMPAEESNPVFFHVLYSKTTENDVACVDSDTDIISVSGIDGAASAIIQYVGARPPRFVHGKRGVAIQNLLCALHGEVLAPGGPPTLGSPTDPFKGQGDIVGRSRGQVNEATAIIGLAFGRVNGVVTQWKARAPPLLTTPTVLDPHVVLCTAPRRRPVDADAVECGNQKGPALSPALLVFREGGRDDRCNDGKYRVSPHGDFSQSCAWVSTPGLVRCDILNRLNQTAGSNYSTGCLP